MIPLLIGGFLILLFIVFVYLSTTTWRGWHIAAASLAFVGVLGFVIVASLSQRTHAKWKKEHAQLEDELTEQQELSTKLEIGDPTLVEPDEPSVNVYQQRVNRLLLDRGRVWRRCTPAPFANNRVEVSTIPFNDDGSPGEPNENGINQNMILYAFQDAPLTLASGARLIVPRVYLGEFQVVQAQPIGVTLTPTMPLDSLQSKLLTEATSSWTLYEMMPLDSHRVFSNEDSLGRPLDNTTDQPVFGDMDEKALRVMFAGVTGLGLDAPIVTQLVTPYLKDGYAASDEDVNMFPTNIWQKLEFEKAHKERVDSNNLDPGISGSFFDREGYAEVTRLRSGEEISVQVNDIGLFPYGYDLDKQAVDQLTATGICQKIGPVFVRSLRDYEEALHDTQKRLSKRMDETARVNRDIEKIQSTIIKTQKQIEYRQAEREKLTVDRTGFARDNEKISQLVAALDNQKTTLTEELSEVYRTNLALSRQLAIYSAKLTEEINRRAANVAMQ